MNKSNYETAYRLSYKMFKKIGFWLSQQDILGLPDINEDAYRKDGHVYRVIIKDAKLSLTLFGDNATVEISDKSFRIINKKSQVDIISLAGAVSKVWLEVKSNIESVLNNVRTRLDKDVKTLGDSLVSDLSKALKNEEYWK